MNGITQAVIELVKAARTGQNPDSIEKSDTFNTTNGSLPTNYNLEHPAKVLVPIRTPLRNMTNRRFVGNQGGTVLNWKVINSLTNGALAYDGTVPEGARGDALQVTESDKSAAFKSIDIGRRYTDEAFLAGKGVLDLQARKSTELLAMLFLVEEGLVLGGNASYPLNTTPTPATPTTATTGGTIPAGTYDVICVGLTYYGWRNNRAATTSIVQAATINGLDGSTFVRNAGTAAPSAASATVTTTGTTSTVTTTVGTIVNTPTAYSTNLNGYYAYAWYIGTAGAEKFSQITTVPTATFLSLPTGSNQSATSLVAADKSVSLLHFDGLLSQIAGTGSLTPVSVPYFKQLNATTLTFNNAAGIVEIDDMLDAMWNNAQISPEIMMMNNQQFKDISRKILGGGNVKYNVEGGLERPGGLAIRTYYNPTTQTDIVFWIHQDIPPGTILAFNYELPPEYSIGAATSQTWEMVVQEEYTQEDWPRKSRAWETSVHTREVLCLYAPFSLAVLTGIQKG